MPTTGSALPALLRAWRERALLTQQQLAERTGLGVRTIRRLESGGVHRPHGASMRLIADALRLTDDDRAVLAGAIRGPVPQPAVAGPVPRQLPADIAGFTGRRAYLREMDELLAGTAGAALVLAIAGTAGVGKTALAVHWAHRTAHLFPDGQLYVNLRGFDPGGVPLQPFAALRGFLDALGMPPARIPTELDAQAALYRSLLAGRRFLVLLDNARDAEQLRPLLPGTSGCLAVITSRHQLTGLVAAVGARPLALDLLSTVEARELLARRLGPDRVAAEPEAADEIVTLCARLPLALAVAAARAATDPDLTLAGFAHEMRDTRNRLDSLGTGDPMTDARGVFSWSYHRLAAGAAGLFRLLGLHPGPDIGAPAAASLAGIGPRAARSLLAELTEAHLVAEHAPGRYAFHDLLRAYAAEQGGPADGAGDQRAARHRMVDHYRSTAHAADWLLDPDREAVTPSPLRAGVTPEELANYGAAMAWFDAERAVLLAIIEQSTDATFDGQVCRLAKSLTLFLDRRGHWRDLLTVQHAALVAAQRLGDRPREAITHCDLGLAQARLGRYDAARASIEQALSLQRALDNPGGQANAHSLLCWMLGTQHLYPESLRHAQLAHRMFRRAGHRAGQANALNSIGYLYALVADHRRALTYCRRALRIFQELGNRFGEAHTWDSIGFAHRNLDEHPQAVRCYERAATLFEELGDQVNQAASLTRLGDTWHATGDRNAAHRVWRRALEILDGLGGIDTAPLRAKLAR